MLRCVVFDMDGTILDTERLSVLAWQAAGKKFGYDIPSEFIMGYFGMGWSAIDQLYFKRFGMDFPMKEVRAERMDWALRYFEKNPVPVKPGARELLEKVRSLKVTTALATSTHYDRATLELERAELLKLFEVVVTGDMVERGKPAPDIFLMALERGKCSPADGLIVEDSENGARAGLAAGCRTVVIPDLRQPGEEIRKELYGCYGSLLDLIPVVEELAKT